MGGVDGDDAGGEGVGLGGGEALGGEEVEHGLAGGEGFDGCAEVFVAGAVVGEETGDEGEDAVEVEAVDFVKRGAREGEVEEEEVSAGVENAGHFAQGAGPGLHVAQAEGDGDGVEGSVGKGEAGAVGGDERVEAFAGGDLQHGEAEVGADDAGLRKFFLQGEGEVTAAGGEVEDGAGLPWRDETHGAGAPEEVEATGEKMVGEVVARGDATENAADLSGVLHREKMLTRGLEPPRVTPCASETHASASSAT